MVANLVTVIIVNYNSGPMLTKCIDKILSNSIPVNILISDNASSDNSISLLEQQYPNYPSIFIQKNKTNLGFSAANNIVYSKVDTPFVLYLNPDCFIETDTIEHFINLMHSMPEAGIAGCLVKNTDGSEQAGCRGLTPTPWRIISQFLNLSKLFPESSFFSSYLLSGKKLPKDPIFVELISGSCMFVRKEAIEDVGLLDDTYFLYCEDYDWFHRFILKKWKIIFTPHTSVTHIKGHSAKSIPLRVLWYKAKGMWHYHDKFFKQDSNIIIYLFIKAGIILRLFSLGGLELLKKCIKNNKVRDC
ncbi:MULTISPECIES: glycosyltransferase family 2 protein [unclassified Legionella]|uniref:glycosyltransferase family 2 protein n=1 Tax=unclassified Legionella TaxID=2622702 RepID=UPI00105612D0|nr:MULTISPECIES: glycosyltransferase family 2 protein [unclassified Legionella]MDI9817757.1 glycosyltransferase family 2 protein [Legionella sp. PL877]